jgi:hypothetical protein
MEFDEASGVLTWQYDTTLYSHETVSSMEAVLRSVLAHCASQPEEALPAALLAPRAPYLEVLQTDLPLAGEVRERVAAWQRQLKELLRDTNAAGR